MANFSQLYPEIKLLANQCPNSTIDNYIVRAARIFCQDSKFYQRTIVLNQTDTQAVYPLILSGVTDEVVGIESVEQDNRPLYPLDQKDYSNAFGGISRGFQFEPPNLLVIVPTPSQYKANGIKARCILQPSETASTLDESIYRRWKYAIQDGALAGILSMQNEPWSNSQLAGEKEASFREGISKAFIQRERGFQPRDLYIKPRSFL
jgi:hypothetical protein